MAQTPTEPAKDDQPPAVVLQEPQRPRPTPDWAEGFALQSEETAVPGLHPGWAEVLSEGETPLWQGAPTPDPHRSLGGFPLIVLGFIGVAFLLGSGLAGPVLPFVLVVGYLLFRHRLRKAKPATPRDRRYLLTSRAAYLARQDGPDLRDIKAFPITPLMRLSLAPRAVTFITRRDLTGGEELEGFIDISDAQQVHDLIRAVQKGKA